MSDEVPPGAAKTSLGGIEFLSYMDSYLMEDPSRKFAVRVRLFGYTFPCAYKD